jgi:antitoxin HicB
MIPYIDREPWRRGRGVPGMNKLSLRYSMLIEWSDEDQAYLVTLPEWADHVLMPATHGDTYIEAVQHGQEVLSMLVESAKRDGEPLPAPRIHAA